MNRFVVWNVEKAKPSPTKFKSKRAAAAIADALELRFGTPYVVLAT